MLAKALGIMKLDFTTPDGKTVEGVSLYCAYEDANVIGYKTDRFYVRKGVDMPAELKPNDNIELHFDRKGKVEEVILVKK